MLFWRWCCLAQGRRLQHHRWQFWAGSGGVWSWGLLHGLELALWGPKPSPADARGRGAAPAAPAAGSSTPRHDKTCLGTAVCAQPGLSITRYHMWLSTGENRCSVLSNPYGNRLASLCCRMNYGRRRKAESQTQPGLPVWRF